MKSQRINLEIWRNNLIKPCFNLNKRDIILVRWQVTISKVPGWW